MSHTDRSVVQAIVLTGHCAYVLLRVCDESEESDESDESVENDESDVRNERYESYAC